MMFFLFAFLLCSLTHCILGKSIDIDFEKATFVKDGASFRYISGSFHYFRTPAFYWKDRLQKMKAAGLNTVQTYVPWQLHEPFPGQYNFKDELNLFGFLSAAKEAGLMVILRPGPYIDNLNDFGGMPSWLLWGKNKVPTTKLRTSDPKFLQPVFRWFDHLFPLLVPHLYANGGQVFAIQVENELGSYGSAKGDELYLEALIRRFQKHFQKKVILFSTDSGYFGYLQKKKLIFPTTDFGWYPSSLKAVKDRFNLQKHAIQRLGFPGPGGPLVNSEYYVGWHTYWGEKFQTRPTVGVANTLGYILSLNASVNMFMFAGGTIYGFHGGSDDGNYYGYKGQHPAPTTWDYDAPISEAGDPRSKLFALRKVIQKYSTGSLPPVPKATKKSVCAASWNRHGKGPTSNYIHPLAYVPLDDALEYLCPPEKRVTSKYPLTFEDLQQDYGYVLYRTKAKKNFHGAELVVKTIRDRGIVYVNSKFIGVLNRNGNDQKSESIKDLTLKQGDRIDILVENLGRRCSEGLPYNEIYKGLLSNVTLGNTKLMDWQLFSLPLNNTNQLLSIKLENPAFDLPKVQKGHNYPMPGFFVYNFTMVAGGHLNPSQPASAPCLEGDAFFDMSFLKKGQLFVNDVNIGRYWTQAGPQHTLYIARPYLHFSGAAPNVDGGLNLALAFETDGLNSEGGAVLLRNHAILNGSYTPIN